MKTQWELAISNARGDGYATAAECLRSHSERQNAWIPDLSNCSIFVRSEDKEWLVSNEQSFGRADYLVLAFEQSYERLSRGEFAIIRSGEPEEIAPPCLLLEAPKDNVTYVTLFWIGDINLVPKLFFGQEFYDYVQENLTEIVRPTGSSSQFTRLPFLVDELLTNLQREAKLGRQLIDLFGMPDGSNWL